MKNQMVVKQKKLTKLYLLMFLTLILTAFYGKAQDCNVPVNGIQHVHMDCTGTVQVTSLTSDGVEGTIISGLITSDAIHIFPGYSSVRVVPEGEETAPLSIPLSHTTRLGNGNDGISGRSNTFEDPVKPIKIYINPIQDKVLVSFEGASKIIYYKLYDLYGKTIMQNHIKPTLQHGFSIEGIKKGLYILKLQLENGDVLTKKILKQ